MSTQRPKSSGKPAKIDLVIKDFEKLLDDQGCFVRITPSVVCPRRSGGDIDETSVNHDLNCPVCENKQVVDLDDLAVEDWAYIQSIKLDKVFDESSRLDIKDAFISCRRAIRLGYWYKIEILDFGSQFNELILRTNDDVDHTRYKILDPEDFSQFALIDSEGVRYVKDTDYEADYSNQTIKWLTSNRPATGKLYSFLYPVIPTFRVLELMHENRYYYDSEKKPYREAKQLPQQAHIRWDFMAKGSGSDVDVEG
jgi:hypothetical protein